MVITFMLHRTIIQVDIIKITVMTIFCSINTSRLGLLHLTLSFTKLPTKFYYTFEQLSNEKIGVSIYHRYTKTFLLQNWTVNIGILDIMV